MNQENFKLEYQAEDNRGVKLLIWSGPSVKGSRYKALGVDPEKDRVYYIQIIPLTSEYLNFPDDESIQTYRFKYDDQIKLLEFVINNKQLPNAKVKYILMMIEKLISWIPNDGVEIHYKEKLAELFNLSMCNYCFLKWAKENKKQ